MVPLVFLLGTLALLAGFAGLTVYEAGRGTRFLREKRERLDRSVSRAVFVVQHVDFAAFLRDEIRTFVRRIGHDVAHLTLQAVRILERLLTRIVRYFRTRQANAEPRGGAREFVKTLTDFKEKLKANPPEIPEIQKEG